MKILIDQNLPPAIAAFLRDRDMDATHTEECGLGTSSDAEILERCVRESRIIFTRDADFHALLAASGLDRPRSFAFASSMGRKTNWRVWSFRFCMSWKLILCEV